MKKREKTIILGARIVSLVFTPFYLPLLGLMALFAFSYLSLMPWAYKLQVLTLVYVFTILLPTVLIHLYRRYQGWTLIELGHKERRMVPYVISILCYFFCIYLMDQVHIPHFMSAILSAALFIQVACALINVWWKISTHTAAVGGVAGALFVFGELFGFNPVRWLCLVFILAGVLGTLPRGGRLFYSWIFLFLDMKPLVSIIMGSTSDLPVMEKACKLLDELQVPFEVNALSAHRTPDAVEQFAQTAKDRGVKVIIAGAGMAAALPGVIAASTTLPVIGVPIKGMLDGLDALLSIVQMPPGIPVATVGVNGAQNAAILAVQMMALYDAELAQRLAVYKGSLRVKIEKANEELSQLKYEYKV